MDLLSGILIGRETLMSHGLALAATADNISNSNTTGFKGVRPEFSDLLAQSQGSLFGEVMQSGDGAKIAQLHTLFTQGPVEATQRGLDFAISGRGLFVLNDGENTSYTRAGNFTTDAEGFLIAESGEKVMGFTAESPATAVPLNISEISATATASTQASITGNLDVQTTLTEVPTPTSFFDLNAATTFSGPMTVIDTLGVEHDVSLHFFHTGNLDWTVQAYVDGADVGGTAGTPSLVGSSTLTFGSDGLQAEGAAPLAITAAWGNGAGAANVAVDLSKMTGLAGTSAFKSLNVDGNSAGEVTGVEVASDGKLSARLTNGQLVDIGTVLLARFANESGLERIGNNRFTETAASGAAETFAPGTEGLGTVGGSSLENSAVDPATEFIEVIRFQRGYQSGSQVITTFNQLLEKTIQIA